MSVMIYDYLNEEKRRNIYNVDKEHYNCGGYALNTFSWYMPTPDRTWNRQDTSIKKMVKTMLEDFPNLRVIKNLNELKENEYPIVFRIGFGDFHYVKRGKNNVWYHKRGAWHKIERMSKDEVFSDEWADGYYTSKITLFAMKNAG